MLATTLALVAIIVSTAAYMGYRQLWDQRDLDRFTDSMERVEAILDRMELATFVVAADLSTAKAGVETVATDLAAAQKRADEVTEGEPGEAADAGAQSGVDT